MITAVDTNVLLDVLVPSAPRTQSSLQALTQSRDAGPIVISEPVYAELAGHFATREQLDRFLGEADIQLHPSSLEALYLAGRAWRDYLRRRPDSLACPSCSTQQQVSCTACGTRLSPRQHVVPDFLIGAHAAVHTDRLLTRDRGFYRTYFRRLRQA